MNMENEVVVTRAPRVKTVLMKSIQCGTYCCNPSDNGETYYTSNKGFVRIEMEGNAGLLFIPWADASDVFKKAMVYVFGSFDEMSKWVAGGRKLEDLQVDTKSEWIDVGKMPIGGFATLCPGASYHILAHDGDTVMMGANLVVLQTGIQFTQDQAKGMPFEVWPVRFDLGDTITIKAK